MSNPNDLSCQEVVELVTDYLEHVLLPQQQSLLEAHLAECNGCETYLDQMRQTITLLHQLHAEPATPVTRDNLLAIFRGWQQQESGA